MASVSTGTPNVRKASARCSACRAMLRHEVRNASLSKVRSVN